MPSATTANEVALLVSGDNYQGGPEFTVKIDGLLESRNTISASHKFNQSDQINIGGLTQNSKYISISLKNDLYNAQTLEDRNLYVDALNTNGSQQTGRTALFSSNYSGSSAGLYGNNDFAVYRLNSNANYTDIANELGENREFFGIVDLYRGLLDRDPDEDGLLAYATFASSTDKFATAVESVVNSREFANGHSNITSAAFVDVLYQGVLKRAADDGGRTNWVDALAGGMTRGQVATAFVVSTENQNQFLSEIASR